MMTLTITVSILRDFANIVIVDVTKLSMLVTLLLTLLEKLLTLLEKHHQKDIVIKTSSSKTFANINHNTNDHTNSLATIGQFVYHDECH